MSEDQLSFIAEFKKQAIITLTALFFVGLFTAIGFYYTTASNLERVAIEQIILKEKQEKTDLYLYELNEKKINKDDYNRDNDELIQRLIRMENKIDNL
jgi:hypothetical protein